MIIRPEKMDFTEQKFSAIIYGSPGIGKTTLACSAPSPLLIDFDRGVSRVRAQHRCPTVFADQYEDVLADITSPEMSEFDTIIIDTGGSFVTYLKDWAMRTKPGARQKNGEFSSLKGFGFVKAEFSRFTEHITKVLNKNVIYVFHSQEQADKDGNPTQRLLCEGSARNTVWNSCDFGGYLQMIGRQRVICFTPEQEFFAKGTHGIYGQIPVPELGEKDPNNFMTLLFKKAKSIICAENEIFKPQHEQYEKVMAEVRSVVNIITDAETANKAAEALPNMQHILTSKKEASALLREKTDALGLKYTKDKGYIPKGE